MEVAQLIGLELRTKVDSSAEALTVNSTSAKPKNTYAGNYGFGRLPLHTDLAHWYIPPRYLMLRCAVGDPEVGTPLLHYREVVRKLSPVVIDRALFRPRRRLEGKMYLLRLRESGIFRWDQLFLTPENKEAEQVQSLITLQHSDFKVVEIVLDKSGRTILIDNWNILHGRTMVKSNQSPRRIERVYFAEE